MLVTGIVNPYPLKEHLQKNHGKVISLTYKDHHRYTVKDMQDIKTKYDAVLSGKKVIVTTEKDAMRLEHPDLQDYIKDLPIFYIPVEVVLHNKNQNDSLDQIILDYVKKNSRNS